ncbi:MAG: hypothetical protein ACRDY2_09390 [Acidimicrobiales bacterium]
MTVTDLARWMATLPDDRDRWRAFFEFLDEYDGEPPEGRGRLLAGTPPLLNDLRWDTCVAALAEHLSLRDGLQPPGWVRDAGRALDRFWFPAHTTPATRAEAYVTSPASFACRGIFIERHDLARA